MGRAVCVALLGHLDCDVQGKSLCLWEPPMVPDPSPDPEFLWRARPGQVLPDHRTGDRETVTVTTTLSGEEVDLLRGFPARDSFDWGQERLVLYRMSHQRHS